MNYDGDLRIRISSTELERFKDKCAEIHRPYQDMVREMIAAFSEGRVKITKTKAELEHYHVD